MMRTLHPARAFLVALCLWAAACTQLPVAGDAEAPLSVPAPVLLAVPEDAARAAGLLEELAAATRLGPVEQRKLFLAAQRAYKMEPSAQARVRLGGLLAQPGSSLRDDVRALAVLEPLSRPAQAEAAGAVGQLGALLHAQVSERLRSAREDAQKQDRLRQQLEAMKAVERAISEREDRLPRAPARQ